MGLSPNEGILREQREFRIGNNDAPTTHKARLEKNSRNFCHLSNKFNELAETHSFLLKSLLYLLVWLSSKLSWRTRCQNHFQQFFSQGIPVNKLKYDNFTCVQNVHEVHSDIVKFMVA